MYCIVFCVLWARVRMCVSALALAHARILSSVSQPVSQASQPASQPGRSPDRPTDCSHTAKYIGGSQSKTERTYMLFATVTYAQVFSLVWVFQRITHIRRCAAFDRCFLLRFLFILPFYFLLSGIYTVSDWLKEFLPFHYSLVCTLCSFSCLKQKIEDCTNRTNAEKK